MIQAKLICPHCRTPFTLKAASMESLSGKVFKCPKCGVATPFDSMSRRSVSNSAASLRTHIAPGPGGNGGGKTQVARPNYFAMFVSEDTGRQIPLPKGVQILGRESSDSRATVRIAPDPYMSRAQARTELTENPEGGVICRLVPLKSTNTIFVNDKPIGMEGVFLRDGDRLLMGMTKLIFNTRKN